MSNNFVDTITGVQNPVIGTVAISDISATVLTVTGIYRYDGAGSFVCSVTDGINFNGMMEVYYSNANARFQAKDYIPTRYPDEDGVKKGL